MVSWRALEEAEGPWEPRIYANAFAGVWAEGLDREWTPGLERKFKWFVGLPPQHLTMDFFVPLLVSGRGARVLGAGGVRYPTGVLSG